TPSHPPAPRAATSVSTATGHWMSPPNYSLPTPSHPPAPRAETVSTATGHWMSPQNYSLPTPSRPLTSTGPWMHPSPATATGSRQPWQNSNPFIIVSLSNRVKKCAGCPYEFRNPQGPLFIGLVIQHKERDFYTDPNGLRRLSTENNRYYHCHWPCLRPRHPYINKAIIRPDPTLIVDDFQRASVKTLLDIEI
ncbi:hypothetical protein AC249_AIPGENE12550, partial [Exaiptasia diaphana]